MGDTIYSNVIMVGCAWQQGLIPVSLAALLRAIELNGIKIEENKQAFTWGRIAAHNAAEIERILDGSGIEIETLDSMIERRRAFLKDYQNDALAERYVELVDRAREAESAVADDNKLATAIAKSYFRVLSYKDEYEVARLHTDENFLASLRRNYGDRAKLRFHLAPPLLNGKRDARGRPLKKEFGAWVLPLFRLLASMKKLRGTAFDIFGYTAERRTERQLITIFEDTVDNMLLHLDADNI
jgi:indolepyruvate ferredoxin oxidoreductase